MSTIRPFDLQLAADTLLGALLEEFPVAVGFRDEGGTFGSDQLYILVRKRNAEPAASQA